MRHKDVDVREKRRNAYIGGTRWRSVGKGSISWHTPPRKLREDDAKAEVHR